MNYLTKTVFILMLLISSVYCQHSEEIRININNVNFPMANNGENGLDGGVIFDSLAIVTSACGFYLSGYVNDSLWSNGVFHSNFVSDYLPGNVGRNPNDEKNKFYTLSSKSADFDSTWLNWKDAVQQGAYFYDGNNDGEYNPIDQNGNGIWDSSEDRPDIMGDYTAWCVFNDSKPKEERTFNDVTPKGIEIGQTVFAYFFEDNNLLNNVVFIRYVITNKGTITNTLDSVYFSLAVDPDIGDYWDDLTGCNIELNSTFAYNNKDDEQFGNNPPAVLVSLLQGPIVADATNKGINRRGPLLGEEIFENAKNMKMVSSTSPRRRAVLIPIRFADPKNKEEAHHLIEGAKYHDGTPISVSNFPLGNGEDLGSSADTINPKYMFSGNPAEHTGWLSAYESDWRIMNSTGPFNLTVGEPVELIYAYIIGRANKPRSGYRALKSLTIAKEAAIEVKKFYESNFVNIPVGIKDKPQTQSPAKYSLSQNYPNPFNPTTTIKYSIPNLTHPLIPSREGKERSDRGVLKNVTLKVYDILGREVATLVNKKQQPGNYKVKFDASSLTSGMYFYELKSGSFRTVKKMLLLR